MKRVFYTLTMLFVAFGTYAQPLLNENFNYTVGNLNTLGGWTALATPNGACNVVSGNLSYTGYDAASQGIGNSVQLTSGSSKDDLAKVFNGTAINSGAVYASFILTVNGITTSNPVSYPICLMPSSGSNNVCRLLISSPSSGNVQFGIQRNSGTGAAQSQDPTLYPFTSSVTTFMIVLKYDFSNSTASLFVNPTLGGSEPTANATNATGTAFTDLQRFQLRQGDAAGNYDITIDGLRIGTSWSGGTLPVSYKSFAANRANNETVLRWSTASETNNSHFEVQRSTDGKNYVSIAEVKGKGTTNKTQSYSYADVDVLKAKTVYYRLKQVDYDGQFEYSKTVSVVNTTEKTGISATTPNPFNSELNVFVNASNAGTAQVEVLDMIGKMHYSNTQLLSVGNNKVEINTADMPMGIYFVRVQLNGETFTQKVIKK